MKLTQKTLKIFTTFFALEILPILLFFILFAKTRDFPLAVTVLACSVTISILLSIWIQKRIPYFTVIVASTTILASYLTIANDNPQILIIRDTVYYTTFGAALLIASYKKHLPLKKMFETIFGITDSAWEVLGNRWGVFLLITGAANAIIGLYLPLPLWVTYKASILILFTLFGTYQFTLTKKHRLEKTNSLGIWQ